MRANWIFLGICLCGIAVAPQAAAAPDFCSCRVFCGTDYIPDQLAATRLSHPLIPGKNGPSCPGSIVSLIPVGQTQARGMCGAMTLPVSRVDCDPVTLGGQGPSFVPAASGRAVPTGPPPVYLE